MIDLSSQRVAVTGGAGFLGSHVGAGLRARGCRDVVVPRKAEYDLTREEAVARFYADHHLIPALVRKFVEAREAGARQVVVWGDGTATREFLFVTDAAEAILRATERYDGAEPVNIGAGFEISIRDLAQQIAQLTGFTGEIAWDTSKPNGQPRRCLDVSRAERLFNFRATTSFDAGLKRTVEWYQRHRANARVA